MESYSFRVNRFIEYGIASKTMPGENVCGDSYLVKIFSETALIGVIDGLGHGNEAALAAKTAVEVLENSKDEPLEILVNRCHEALRHTKGAAMSLASFRHTGNALIWIGIGNVEGVVVHKNPENRSAHESLLLRGGVVGYNIPTLRSSSLSLSEGDTLIFATDGILSSFSEMLTASTPPQTMADSIIARFWRKTDDALVLVVRYLGGNH
jgi:phosphoserine phosphatase RsbX